MCLYDSTTVGFKARKYKEGGMKKKETFRNKLPILCFILITVLLSTAIGGCATLKPKEIKDTISNLSFSHDGKKVLFDRCREDCQIQVYDLETGELAAYQSPKNERWTMARQSYDGKKVVFSVMPVVDGHLDLAEMQIAVMDTDGRNYRKVTTGQGAKLYPVLSHSGTKVLYARAAHIRTQGRTPASQYDAWEVDLATGRQTRLTFFKYYYMGNLNYYPDDERFIYYGDMPSAFPGLEPAKANPVDNQEKIRQGQIKPAIPINGVVAMKRGDTLPWESFNFGEKFYAKKPLLSRDGSNLIVEKGISGGDFYLYSPNGNHRLIGGGGSVNSAAISPDGELLAIISVKAAITISRMADSKRLVKVYVPSILSEKYYKELAGKIQLLPELPSRIINK